MIEVPSDKFIFDACCGNKMMWYNKEHPNTIYNDMRKGKIELSKGWGSIEIKPDTNMDFRKLKFKDNSFRLVVFDPPHLRRCGSNSCLGKKFGVLNAETWQSDLQRGFKECWRILQTYGILIFKWNDHDIKLKTILNLIPEEPLFGQKTCGSGYSQTYWFTFMKIPRKEGVS